MTGIDARLKLPALAGIRRATSSFAGLDRATRAVIPAERSDGHRRSRRTSAIDRLRFRLCRLRLVALRHAVGGCAVGRRRHGRVGCGLWCRFGRHGIGHGRRWRRCRIRRRAGVRYLHRVFGRWCGCIVWLGAVAALQQAQSGQERQRGGDGVSACMTHGNLHWLRAPQPACAPVTGMSLSRCVELARAVARAWRTSRAKNTRFASVGRFRPLALLQRVRPHSPLRPLPLNPP